ncbi:hypothetical protein [Sphingobacterium detergens]|uniref:hypothetical protein n=1 Tax=Sphingobacterium detergens TaxID=1145106 RepID=UPI000E7346C7|nr:hypothetical protein [Sphingobacterium detergens]
MMTILSRPFRNVNLDRGWACIYSAIGHTSKDSPIIIAIESQNLGKVRMTFVFSVNSIAASAEPIYMVYNPIGKRIDTVVPTVITKMTILKKQCSNIPVNFFGKLILSKLLNDTANDINMGIRISDQSHLMQTKKIMLAKMQQSDVIAILIICIHLFLDLSS